MAFVPGASIPGVPTLDSSSRKTVTGVAAVFSMVILILTILTAVFSSMYDANVKDALKAKSAAVKDDWMGSAVQWMSVTDAVLLALLFIIVLVLGTRQE